MAHSIRVFSTLILCGSFLFTIGCSGDDTGGSEGSGGGSGATNGATSAETTGAAMCAMQCAGSGDCPNLECSCGDGSVVNTTFCNNGCCSDKAGACPGACQDYGGWAG
jgi:hypothetical protein